MTTTSLISDMSLRVDSMIYEVIVSIMHYLSHLDDVLAHSTSSALFCPRPFLTSGGALMYK